MCVKNLGLETDVTQQTKQTFVTSAWRKEVDDHRLEVEPLLNFLEPGRQSLMPESAKPVVEGDFVVAL